MEKKTRIKIRMVQAFTGAVVLTLLMQVFGMTGFGQYMWLLFLPLLLFFALGADFKKIPSMIVCYVCGVAWAYINGILQELFRKFSPEIVVNIVPTIIIIFLVLTVHENLFSGTVLGNVPALFMGMSTTFFVFMTQAPINGLYLIGFYLYGIFLAVALVLAGMGVCSLIFGKEKAFEAITGQKPQKPEK